ncbi:crossover junction endonuclease MUS81 [Acrasis kona]|uniref:Crossover junction endonuclease MUS81 n=1 Tax=Acrasis kona TaxID=1008807 RepID=A0AAW2YRM0_9EUKA
MKSEEPANDDNVGIKINPHIVACLKKLEQTAKDKKREKQRIVCAKALRAAERYPLPIRSGSEARSLDGVGPVLAQKIDDYLLKCGVLKKPSIERSPKKVTNNREYKPQFRSAAWALLVALYRNLNNSKGYYKGKMTKTELVSQASSLSDIPMTASGGRLAYSGWSCMKGTLIKKRLVIHHKRTKPPRFALTSDGIHVAEKLDLYANEMTCQQTDTCKVDKIEKQDDKVTSPTNNECVCNVHYVDSNKAKVSHKDEAGVEINDKGVNFLVCVENVQKELIQHLFQSVDSSNENVMYAWISDSTAPNDNKGLCDMVNPFCSVQKVVNKKRKVVELIDDDNDNEEEVIPTNYLDFNSFKCMSPKKTKINPHQLFSPTHELVLLIDQREKANRQFEYIYDRISKKVTTRRCQLCLGDMLWVARNIKTQEEIVLDFIIERKAVGDLAASIVDGRYKEQRYRMRESGICNVMYVIEGSSSLQQGRLPKQNMEQAVIRLISSDGFFVRQTPTVDATIELLEQMTKIIHSMLEQDGLESHAFTSEQDDMICFEEFSCSLDNVFGRMLCHVDDISTRHAESVLQVCKTPNQLADMFKKDGEMALAALPIQYNFEVAKEDFGSETSKNLYEMYTKDNYN